MITNSGGLAAPAPGGTPVGFLGVGAAFGSGGPVGSGANASGALHVTNGDISGFQIVSVGQSFGSAANSVGTIEITGGSLNAPQLLAIGQSGNFGGFGGTTDGTVRVTDGQIVMTSTPSQPGFASVCVIFSGGQATGRLFAVDASLTLASLSLGANSTPTGTASGLLHMTRSTANVTEIFAGFGSSA